MFKIEEVIIFTCRKGLCICLNKLAAYSAPIMSSLDLYYYYHRHKPLPLKLSWIVKILQLRWSSCLDTSLLGKSEPWAIAAQLVNDVLALEEDVTEDAEANTVVGLNTTKASAITNGRVVDVLAGNGLLDATNSDGEVRKGSSAREDVATLSSIILRTADLGVVGTDNGSVGVDESGAGVKNTSDSLLSGCGTDAVGRCTKPPESLAIIRIDVGDWASVLALVNVSEVVGAGSMVLECDSEQRLGELRLDGVEECLLLDGLHGIDRTHCKTEETISVSVLREGCGDRGSSLNSLGGSCYTTNCNLIGIDLARST